MSACPYCKAENEAGAVTCFTCGRGLGTLTKGAVLASRYEILRPLGRGGMGMVYEARDQVLDEVVALKVMRPEHNESADLARRFRSEIKLARKVTHPNVCRIHDYGEDGLFRYISMELIQGRDLKHSLLEKRLSPEEAYDAAFQIVEGLQAIHKVGIVHRDLKTPNIMRDADGLVRLMDFGIAKQFEVASGGGTATGHIVGTPEYMSPEQVRGERVDQRSDIYAAGVVIFELFTGRVPFRGDTPMATLYKHIEEPVPFAEAQAAGLPGALVPILARAMAKDRTERFSSAAELADALRQARAGPLPAPGPAPASRMATAVDLAPTPMLADPTPVPTPVPTEVKTAVIAPAPPAPTAVWLPGAVAATPRTSRARTAIVGGAIAVSAAAAGVVAWFWPKPPVLVSDPPPIMTMPRVTAPPAGQEPTPPVSTAPRVHPAPSPSASPTRAAPPSPTTIATRPPATSLPPARPEDSRAESQPPPITLPAPTTLAAGRQEGSLQLYVVPWAEVSIDGRTVGTTPIRRQSLPAGRHRLRLVNPRYEPVEREIQIVSGETLRVQVNLEREAKPRK